MCKGMLHSHGKYEEEPENKHRPGSCVGCMTECGGSCWHEGGADEVDGA